MDDDRLPKQILFAEGIAPRPRHGPKKRWRDSVMGDLQSLGGSDDWFMLVQEREQRRRLQYQQQPQPAAARELVCQCGWKFRRRNNISGHWKFCKAQWLSSSMTMGLQRRARACPPPPRARVCARVCVCVREREREREIDRERKR